MLGALYFMATRERWTWIDVLRIYICSPRHALLVCMRCTIAGHTAYAYRVIGFCTANRRAEMWGSKTVPPPAVYQRWGDGRLSALSHKSSDDMGNEPSGSGARRGGASPRGRRLRPLGRALATWHSGGSASSPVGGGAQKCSEAVRYVSSHTVQH